MKKTLLFTLSLLFISAVGFAQFDGIPTGSGIYINKLIPSPSGSDLTNEYIEIRGAANSIVPTNLYFIVIEGDGDSASRGKVVESIKLGDGLRTFGANGMLVIVSNYTSTIDASVTTNSYSALISSDATVIVIELTGNDVNGSSSSNVSSQTPDIGYDGNLSDATATYMLVTASSDPKNVRIDGTSDASDADGIINSTGVHTTDWVLYDSITYMDDDLEGVVPAKGEYGYGQIVYAQLNASLSANQFITTSAVIVDFNTTSDANYILRQGTKTGFSVNDWIVSANGSSSSVPNWVFSTTSGKCYPDAFLGWDKINTVYGALNPTAESLSVKDEAFGDYFSLYPNPSSGKINIISKSVEVDNVEIFNLTGQRVLSQKGLVKGGVDVTPLAKGIYILKLSNSDNQFSRKIVVE